MQASLAACRASITNTAKGWMKASVDATKATVFGKHASAHRQDAIEDQIVPEGGDAAVGEAKMSAVSILLVEGQCCELGGKAIPVGYLPPDAEHVGLPLL